MEELRELRRYHDAMPEPAPETVSAARSRLHAHMRGKPPRSRRPMWVMAGAVAAALALAVVVVPGGGGGKAPEAPQAQPPTVTELRLRPVANAQDVADNAALLARDEPGWSATSTRWGYVKSLSAQTRVDGGEWLRGKPEVTHTHEQWRRLDDKAFAGMEQGKLKIYKGSEFEVTYSYLLALPTDADQLLARIYEKVDAENARNRASLLESVRQRAEAKGRTPEEAQRMAEESVPALTGEQRDRWAFQMIAMGMGEAALPSRLRAAMYGAMANISGVRYEAGSSDLLERRGITLYHVQDGYLRDEIFINPKTYEYLGYRTIVVKDHKDGPFGVMRKGEIHNWDAVVKAAVVDKAGRRPG